jgi:hypothetical protein
LPFILQEGRIWGFQQYMVATQRAHTYFAPPGAVESTLLPRLVLASGDKVSITVNSFEHGSDDLGMESIEDRLQALLEVKDFRGGSAFAPTRCLLM